MSTTIPPSSTVLVTGINGHIGSHIANEILKAGYKVRGTARTIEKAADVKKVFDERYGSGKVEIVAVKDMAQAGAFDEAIKGLSIANLSLLNLLPKPCVEMHFEIESVPDS